MEIRVLDKLPFVSVTLWQENNVMVMENVLLDTGSASCIFSTDRLRDAGIYPKPTAQIRRIRGVGGDEAVVEIEVNQIKAGNLLLDGFVIEAGTMDYGFAIEGILGFDFLQQAGAVLDLAAMEISTGE
jgi:predicted aspartyl protease